MQAVDLRTQSKAIAVPSVALRFVRESVCGYPMLRAYAAAEVKTARVVISGRD